MTIMHKKVGSINLKWNKRNIKRERKNNKLTKNIKTFAKLWYIIKEWTSLSQSWFWQCHTSPSVKNLLFSSFYHVCLLFSISIPFRSLSRSLLFFAQFPISAHSHPFLVSSQHQISVSADMVSLPVQNTNAMPHALTLDDTPLHKSIQNKNWLPETELKWQSKKKRNTNMMEKLKPINWTLFP